MVKKLTTEQWIINAKTVHGDEYDYSLVNYKNGRSKVSIICKKHGVFQQTPSGHTSGRGCRYCKSENIAKFLSNTVDDFITKALKIHGDLYDYSLTEYINNNSKVKIVCPEHGVFEQTPSSHLRGSKCPTCSGKRSLKKEEFISISSKIHKNKFDYSSVIYKGVDVKVTIICPHHGSFDQIPYTHMKGHGCAKCAQEENSLKQTLSKEEFITNAQRIHGNKYDYSLVDYINAHTKVSIICKEHGVFYQTPNNHLGNKGKGKDCPECAGRTFLGKNKFIERSNQTHGNRYDYSSVVYISSRDHKTTIICHKHGPFEQTPDNHMRGNNCPKCTSIQSKAEDELINFISITNIIKNSRNIIRPKELDIFLPDYNLAIEYCGLYWHTEKFKKDKYYHKNKMDACNKKGIQLLTIFEDEWIYTPNIVKNIIDHRLNRTNKSVGARQLYITEIDKKLANRFLDLHHLQGRKWGHSICIGAYHNDELVSVMTFSPDRNNQYIELSRFATNGNTYAGVASRLLAHYVKKYKPHEIVSFADLRWSNGNLYEQIGFKFDKMIKPDYRYVFQNQRVHKSRFTKSSIMKKFGIDIEGKTESQLMSELGIPKIWDCGKARYVWCSDK